MYHEFDKIERYETDECDSVDGRYVVFTAFINCCVSSPDGFNITKFVYCAYDTKEGKLYAMKVNLCYGYVMNQIEYIGNNGRSYRFLPIEDIMGDERYTVVSNWWFSIKENERKEMMNKLIVDSMI